MARQTDNAWINFRGLDCLWFMAIPSMQKNEMGQTVHFDLGLDSQDLYNRGINYHSMGNVKIQGTSQKTEHNYKKEGEKKEGDVLFTFSEDYNIGKNDRIVVKSWETRTDEVVTLNGQVTQQLGVRFMSQILFARDEDGNVHTPTVDFRLFTEFDGKSRIEWISTPPVAGKKIALVYNWYPIYIVSQPGMNRSFGGKSGGQLLRRAHGFLWDPRTVIDT